MRVGKKPNVVEAKKTRSCVVRLEKVAKKSPNVSPAASEGGRSNITRTTRLSVNTPTTTMAPTPKLRRGVAVATPQETKSVSGPIKKRIVGGNNLQTPQQQQQKTTQSNTANIRSNQKIKIIPRSNKSTPVSTPSRDETPPPPTIAAGRSRRAIKPNPKYASEDLVTPKVVRNVATLGSSSTSRGGSVAPSGGKTRKASTSSDDFYNRNSDDEYDERQDMDNDDDEDIDDDGDLLNDKAYQANEKDDQDDSDFSDLEDEPVVRTVRPRGRPKRVQETTTQTNNKTPQSTVNSQNKRITSSASATTTSSLRSAPSQLQQIRRSLVSANNQRNLNLLSGNGAGAAAGVTAQKRKLQETLDDSSDNETSYTIKRKQLLLSNAAGNKVKVPVRENRINATSTPLNKNRVASNSAHSQQQQQQTVNGSSNKFSNNQTTNPRRAIEITAKSNNTQLRQSGMNEQQQQQQKSQTNQSNLTTQAKLLAAKANRLRSGSPKLAAQKNRQNNGASLAVGTNSTGSSGKTSLNTNSKISDKAKAHQPNNMKTKTSTSPASAAAAATSTVNSENTIELKDDSPNSTMDDFETMPTFTIVNVNDIINKKGDVLITKTKANNNKAPTIIEFSESISLDDEEDDDDDEEEDNDIMELKSSNNKKLPKLPTLNNRKEFGNKKSSSTSSSTAAPLTRSSESLRKLPTKPSATKQPAPQILNHKLGLRNTRVTAKTTTTLTATLTSPDKPAPRILNSMVAKKTQPVKPLIANMEDSADESFPLSLDEDDEEEEEGGEQQHEQQEEETEDEVESRFGKQRQKLSEKTRKQREQNLRRDRDTEDTESQNTEEEESVLQSSNSSNKANYNNTSPVALTPKQTTLTQRKRRMPAVSNTPIVVSSNKKRLTPAAAKENSLAATNQQVVSETTPAALGVTKPAITAPTLPNRNNKNNEKVVISKQGDKIIKKITCFETWYVINMPPETKRSTIIKNQLEMPLIRLANNAKNICLPNDLWSTKVTLYELSPQTLGKGTTYATFTGDLFEHNIKEEDRGKYQPSCVMFRRSIEKSQITRMPYDRAVIFKNKTFYTNIEGKNVRLVGAPSIVNSEREIEILLQVVDTLTLQSDFVEHISIVP